MKGTNGDFVKGRFTKYLETAVDRSRRDYIKKEQMRAYKEVLKEMEFLEYGPKEPEMDPIENCLESVEDISWEPDLIRKHMKEHLGVRLWNCLTVLTDTELQVVYAKVYRQLTFAEIGNILREKPGKIADTYSYARKKIKKGWKKNGNGNVVASGEDGE